MITESEAREIASWYQSSGPCGRRFATFASTGEMSCGLIARITAEQKAAFHGNHDGEGLADLKEYVAAHEQDWTHALTAGMMVVNPEDAETVNRIRGMECSDCEREWRQGEWMIWRPRD